MGAVVVLVGTGLVLLAKAVLVCCVLSLLSVLLAVFLLAIGGNPIPLWPDSP